MLDQAVGAGSNQIDRLNFTVADPQKLQDEARKTAVKDAKRKAALMAGAADAKLGNVITIKDGGGPRPIPCRAAAGWFCMPWWRRLHPFLWRRARW